MRLAILLIPFLGFFLVPAPKTGSPGAGGAVGATGSGGVDGAIDYFRTEAPLFAASCTALRSSIQTMDPLNPRSVVEAKKRLADCRSHYKRIEAFIEYFFRNPARIYNSPPKYEPEEPFMEYQEPVGLQVIESLLYEKRPGTKKKELIQQADAVASSANDLTSLLYDFKADDKQVLESLRVEIVRIMTLGITGYDAPLLKTGIRESWEALRSVKIQLNPYSGSQAGLQSGLQSALDSAIGYLRDHPGFDSFDRLTFLKDYASPLQTALGAFIRESGLEWNTGGALNYRAANLFSPDALLPGKFPGGAGSDQKEAEGDQKELIQLGNVLFFDKALSGNGQRNCATCHDPGKMFTDRLPVSMAIDGHSRLDRNAPTLLYSGFQYKQFWDGRAKTLEDQIMNVLQNPREMGADKKILNDRMKTGPGYDSLIRKAYPAGREGMELAAYAIGAYVRSLHPMNSPYDRYMQGDEKALNAREKKGANLFMGKAQCATCHFLPLFNGLIPPDYKLTEFESLGTTQSDDLTHPRLSPDPGRFSQYPLPFLKGTFKTPTVRNVALTYPYMHNGAFRSLEKVLDFYNKGGGVGLGLIVPEQTLPSAPLHLNQEEIKDIIHFLHALTDSL